MDALERLEAIAEIRALKARYCRLLDRKSWEEWGQVFTADVVMDVSDDIKPAMGEQLISGRGKVVEQVRGFMQQAVTMHQVHEPEIALTAPGKARGIWSMQDFVAWPDGVESPVPFRSTRALGWYEAEYAIEDDQWRIARLKLVRQHAEMN
ncbi:hypothetical protein A7Q26_02130 [Sphingobium sp. TCM1]|nr:hypothetical protein A7Q26_02130 [Sphingobium sp. TCM1]